MFIYFESLSKLVCLFLLKLLASKSYTFERLNIKKKFSDNLFGIKDISYFLKKVPETFNILLATLLRKKNIYL